jgi:hypothetical protein
MMRGGGGGRLCVSRVPIPADDCVGRVVSHCIPVYPVSHSHMPSTHMPQPLQVSPVQWFSGLVVSIISTSHPGPVKPGKQVQFPLARQPFSPQLG